MGEENGVGDFIAFPIMVGVEVKVGEGTVGVRVGTVVGVFVGIGIGVTGVLPNISFIVIEQAESRKTKNRRIGIFFIDKTGPSVRINHRQGDSEIAFGKIWVRPTTSPMSSVATNWICIHEFL